MKQLICMCSICAERIRVKAFNSSRNLGLVGMTGQPEQAGGLAWGAIQAQPRPSSQVATGSSMSTYQMGEAHPLL